MKIIICYSPYLHQSFPHFNSSYLPCLYQIPQCLSLPPPSSLSSSYYLLIFFLHSISLLFPRSSKAWVFPLCCPVYLTLCPVRSEEAKQGCLPLTKPSALLCFLLWVCGILLLESQINMFLTVVRKPRGHIPTRSKCHIDCYYALPL